MNGAQRNVAAMKQLLSNILESRYFCNDVVILKGIVLRRPCCSRLLCGCVVVFRYKEL